MATWPDFATEQIPMGKDFFKLALMGGGEGVGCCIQTARQLRTAWGFDGVNGEPIPAGPGFAATGIDMVGVRPLG